MKLDIRNLNINNYNIDMTIFDNEKLGVYSRNEQNVHDFLELVSGLNNNKNAIFMNDINIFDNKEYFSLRVFFDFSRKYLTTLRVNKIEEALKNYNLKFNKDRFVSICKELNIRGETDITYKYEFTNIGNSFVNLALICSLDVENIIVNNSTHNLNLKSDFDYFSSKLTSSIFNNVILGLDNLVHFKGKLDRIMFFSDFNEIILMDNNDTFIVFDKDIDQFYLIKNKVFKGEKIIALNNYTKDDLRIWQRNKVNFEIISIYDIDKYLGEI